jgi:hypothetical protein
MPWIYYVLTLSGITILVCLCTAVCCGIKHLCARRINNRSVPAPTNINAQRSIHVLTVDNSNSDTDNICYASVINDTDIDTSGYILSSYAEDDL